MPLNQINDDQAEALLAEFGLQGAELEEARDAFLDWRDGDDEPRLRGRERADYAAEGVRPRDGPLRSNGELAAIPAIASSASFATEGAMTNPRTTLSPLFFVAT